MQRGFTPSTKRIVGRPGTGLGLATAYCSGLGSIENCNSEQRFSSDKACFWEDIEGYESGDRIRDKKSMLQTTVFTLNPYLTWFAFRFFLRKRGATSHYTSLTNNTGYYFTLTSWCNNLFFCIQVHVRVPTMGNSNTPNSIVISALNMVLSENRVAPKSIIFSLKVYQSGDFWCHQLEVVLDRGTSQSLGGRGSPIPHKECHIQSKQFWESLNIIWKILNLYNINIPYSISGKF